MGKGLFVRESHIKKRMDRRAIDPRRSFNPSGGLPTLPQSATFSDNQSSRSSVNRTPTPTSLNPSPRAAVPLSIRDRHKSPPIHRPRDLNQPARPKLKLRLTNHTSESSSSVVHQPRPNSTRPSSAKSLKMPWQKRSKERPKSTRSSKSRPRSKSPFHSKSHSKSPREIRSKTPRSQRSKTPRRRYPKAFRSSRPKSPLKDTTSSSSGSTSKSTSSKHQLFGSKSVSTKSLKSKKSKSKKSQKSQRSRVSRRSPRTTPSFVSPPATSHSRSSRSPRMALPNASWQSQRSVTPRNTISDQYDSDVVNEDDDDDDDPDSHDSPPTLSNEAYPGPIPRPITPMGGTPHRHRDHHDHSDRLNIYGDHEEDEESKRYRVLTPRDANTWTPRTPQTPHARNTPTKEKRFPFAGNPGTDSLSHSVTQSVHSVHSHRSHSQNVHNVHPQQQQQGQGQGQGVILPMHRASTVGGTPRRKTKSSKFGSPKLSKSERRKQRKSKRSKSRHRGNTENRPSRIQIEETVTNSRDHRDHHRLKRKRKNRRERNDRNDRNYEEDHDEQLYDHHHDDDGQDGDPSTVTGTGTGTTGGTNTTMKAQMNEVPPYTKMKSHRSRNIEPEELLTPRGGDGTVYVFQRTVRSRKSSSTHSEERIEEQFVSNDPNHPIRRQRRRDQSRRFRQDVQHEEEIRIKHFDHHSHHRASRTSRGSKRSRKSHANYNSRPSHPHHSAHHSSHHGAHHEMMEGSPRNGDTTYPLPKSPESAHRADYHGPKHHGNHHHHDQFRLRLKKQHTDNDRDLYDQGYRIEADTKTPHQPIPLRLKQSYSVDSQITRPRLSLAINESRDVRLQRVDTLEEEFKDLPPEYDEETSMERDNRGHSHSTGVHIRRQSSQTSISSNISHVYGVEESSKHSIHEVSPQLAAQHSLQIEHNKLELLQRDSKELDLLPDTPVLSDPERLDDLDAAFDGIDTGRVTGGGGKTGATSRASGGSKRSGGSSGTGKGAKSIKSKKSRSTTPVPLTPISPMGSVFMSRKCTISEMDKSLHSHPSHHSARASNSTRASMKRESKKRRSLEMKREELSDKVAVKEEQNGNGTPTQNVYIKTRKDESDTNDELQFLSRSNKMNEDEVKMDLSPDIDVEEVVNGMKSIHSKRPNLTTHQLSYDIDESVIEYHVPSVSKRKNQNIKINIHINNDIINGKCKKPKASERERHNDRNRDRDRDRSRVRDRERDRGIAIARAHSADYADLSSADSGDTIEEEHYHQHNLTVNVPKSPRNGGNHCNHSSNSLSSNHSNDMYRRYSPRARSARASTRNRHNTDSSGSGPGVPMMFRSESTHVQATSSRGRASRGASSGSATDELMGAPNGMIKAFSVGTGHSSSTSNVTPQPSSFRISSTTATTAARRQNSNPFVGRRSQKSSLKKKVKSAKKSKSKTRSSSKRKRTESPRECSKRECDHYGHSHSHSQSKSHSHSHSHSHRRHHSSEEHGSSKKRGCSCHKHRKMERESKKTLKKEKKAKKAKKERKEKKVKQQRQIKFRRKMGGQRAYTPRNPVPPISVTPRGVAVERLNAVKNFDWNI